MHSHMGGVHHPTQLLYPRPLLCPIKLQMLSSKVDVVFLVLAYTDGNVSSYILLPKPCPTPKTYKSQPCPIPKIYKSQHHSIFKYKIFYVTTSHTLATDKPQMSTLEIFISRAWHTKVHVFSYLKPPKVYISKHPDSNSISAPLSHDFQQCRIPFLTILINIPFQLQFQTTSDY